MYWRLFCVVFLSAGSAAAAQNASAHSVPTSLEGRTVDASNRPVVRAKLSLVPVSPGTPYGAMSNDQGEFSFSGVVDGQYQLLVEKVGFLRQAYGSKRDLLHGETLTIGAGKPSNSIRFSMVAQAIVSGKVLDQDGDPSPGALVSLLRLRYARGRQSLTFVRSVGSDPIGEFRFFNLAPGRYYLSAMPTPALTAGVSTTRSRDSPEEGYVKTYYSGSQEAAGAEPVEVMAGENRSGADIRLVKARIVRVRGKILAAGSTLKGLGVLLTPPPTLWRYRTVCAQRWKPTALLR
jgi:hypothetical protein